MLSFMVFIRGVALQFIAIRILPFSSTSSSFVSVHFFQSELAQGRFLIKIDRRGFIVGFMISFSVLNEGAFVMIYLY